MGGRDGRGCEMVGKGGREQRESFPIASVGFRAGGDNRKRARSAQRREGPKA